MVRFSTQAVASKRLRVSDGEPAAAMPIPSAPSAPPVVVVAAAAAAAGGAAESTVGAGVASAASGVLGMLDPETLECSVCLESLIPPIYQCPNGHIACHSCREKISDVCPTCSETLGSIRNLLGEKLIESLFLACRYADSGCPQIPKFINKSTHERSCEFRPFPCPIKPCAFTSPLRNLSAHLAEAHQAESHAVQWERCHTILLNSVANHFLLKVVQDATAGHFLLHHDKEQLGSLVYLTCFGSAAHDEYSYQLEVKCGKKRLLFEGVPQCIGEGVQNRHSLEFLVIPVHMFPRDGNLQLDVWLRRSGSSSAKKKITFSETLF